jgi:putative transcriptional regulator
VKDLLPLYALGILDADEAALVEQAVAADPELAAELAIYQEAADRLIAPAVPSDHVLTRLMASAGQGRWERFSSRISALFDLSLDKTRELLGMMERPTSWGEEAPGIFLIHFPAGPAFGPAADCGIVRITPGSRFPWHTHLGDEHSLVLEGAMTEDNGRQFVAGDELVVVDGSQHDLVNEGTVDCIFIARALNGISVRGM